MFKPIDYSCFLKIAQTQRRIDERKPIRCTTSFFSGCFFCAAAAAEATLTTVGVITSTAAAVDQVERSAQIGLGITRAARVQAEAVERSDAHALHHVEVD